jgi:hypothetical protein
MNRTDQELDYLQIIMDAPGGGPRSAYAFHLGRRDYMTNTADLDTSKVEDFSIAFYTEYNQRRGVRY